MLQLLTCATFGCGWLIMQTMVMLKELDLSGNMLSHLSDALGNLPKLEVG